MRYHTPILLSLFFIPVLILLSGCNAVEEYRTAKILNSGWIGPTAQKTAPALYCYETLADPMCYNEPQPGQEGRLIAFYPGLPPCEKKIEESFEQEEIFFDIREEKRIMERRPIDIRPLP